MPEQVRHEYSKDNYKNVMLRRVKKNGYQLHKLIGPEGDEIEAFNIFSLATANLSYNTRKNYFHSIAQVYDYLFEGAYHIALLHNSEGITMVQLKQLLYAWKDYLVHGQNSENEHASLISQTLPSPMISLKSAAIKHSALRHLLKISEQIRSEQQAFVKLGFIEKEVDLNIIYPQINQSIRIDRFQRRGILQSSMLAGVIAGGPQKRTATVLPLKIPSTSPDILKSFPIDKAVELIENCSSYRDKALYSLYAASGCRQHEGLQLLWDDIDIQKRKVKLIDPKSRSSFNEIYKSLTNSEKQKLSWKGRTTSSTFLIEPFASMFFEYLEMYVRHEYIAHGEHGFVFQHLTSRFEGRPYFLSTSETRSQAFHRAAKKLELNIEVHGPHSLRHMYGKYLYNYFPRSNGQYGLPIEEVQQWMGHADIKITKKYADKDREMQKATLAWGNAQVYENGKIKSINQLKIESLKGQILVLEQQQSLTVSSKNAH